MNKLLLALIFLPMSASLTIAQAAVDAGPVDQMVAQQEQLRHQHFDFRSDAYQQTHVQTSNAIRSFKDQLDSQKMQLRPQAPNFFSDRYVQLNHVNFNAETNLVSKASFKDQLESQKNMHHMHTISVMPVVNNR